jgi:4-alpha-glucanotransferase
MEKLQIRSAQGSEAEYEEFRAKQEHCLEDYALFRALKAKYNGAYYLDWSQELIQRNPQALASARRELANQTDQVRFAQFLLFRQSDQLRAYANFCYLALPNGDT